MLFAYTPLSSCHVFRPGLLKSHVSVNCEWHFLLPIVLSGISSSCKKIRNAMIDENSRYCSAMLCKILFRLSTSAEIKNMLFCWSLTPCAGRPFSTITLCWFFYCAGSAIVWSIGPQVRYQWDRNEMWSENVRSQSAILKYMRFFARHLCEMDFIFGICCTIFKLADNENHLSTIRTWLYTC